MKSKSDADAGHSHTGHQRGDLKTEFVERHQKRKEDNKDPDHAHHQKTHRRLGALTDLRHFLRRFGALGENAEHVELRRSKERGRRTVRERKLHDERRIGKARVFHVSFRSSLSTAAVSIALIASKCMFQLQLRLHPHIRDDHASPF